MKRSRLHFDADHSEDGDYAVVARARIGGPWRGELHAYAKGRLLVVKTVEVAAHSRRRGVATQLYEYAAAHACAGGRRLASDEIRSDAAQAFWEKQVQKGRAKCARRAAPYMDRGKGGCHHYVLPCPVESLSGRWRPARRRR